MGCRRRKSLRNAHYAIEAGKFGARAKFPTLIWLAFFYGFNLPTRFGLFAAALFTMTRGLDFYHLSRQAFGMMQLFQGKNNRVVP